MDTRSKNILVVGGSGYIGSHMVKLLTTQGYNPIVLDNLVSGTPKSIGDAKLFIGDMKDESLIRSIYEQYPFSAVIHFAALIRVDESVAMPLKYYENNVAATIAFLTILKKLSVRNIIFSSSAAVYGNLQAELIAETHPKVPVNPYGSSKSMVEKVFDDCCGSEFDDMNVVALRYFNVAGADSTLDVDARKSPPTNFIPILMQAINADKTISVFGNDYKTTDGTCVRDYIHVKDLVQAHFLALQKLEKLQSSPKSKNFFIYNLGTGKGHSVLEVIKAAENVLQKPVKYEFKPRRPGDPEKLVADSKLAQAELGWIPRFSDINTIVNDAWGYENKRIQAAEEIDAANQQLIFKQQAIRHTALTTFGVFAAASLVWKFCNRNESSHVPMQRTP